MDTDVPTSKDGRASAHPSGRFFATSLSSSFERSGLAARHAWNFSSHSARSALARSAAPLRVQARRTSSTSKDFSGSKPRTFFKPASSSAPSFAPWAAPVPCFVGQGQAMIVDRRMNEGLSVTALAFSMAS